jgi:DNA-directed RNA polymerase specialized sigma24 family protein
VILYYYQELTIAEIAELLQIKKGTVKSRLNTARVRLAQMVQGDPLREKVIEC